VDGLDLSSESGKWAVKFMLGDLPQELGLYPDLTARQFTDYMAILKGMDDTRARTRRLDDVLHIVGMADVAGRMLKGFSGGMKRRVGIAQALVNDPKPLIVIEPTAGLDLEERIRFRSLLVSLASDRSVILSTHIIEDIGQTCPDTAVLAHGQVLFRGSPATLIEAARGHVWTLTTNEPEKPNHDMTLVSIMHLTNGIQYCSVGPDAAAYPQAWSAQPGLEDGYIGLMKDSGQEVDVI
jgi:ABC-2 type transport system ATP-binding protein